MKILLAKFNYRDPKTGKEYSTQRGWPCASEEDAQNTVKYYGMKTGALSAECTIEEISNEEIQQAAASTATA